jgi:hypothetical protein
VEQIQKISNINTKQRKIRERRALTLAKNKTHGDSVEVVNPLPAEHDGIIQKQKSYTPSLFYLFLRVTFKKRNNKLRHLQRLKVTPDI